jgi:hypothetical protein
LGECLLWAAFENYRSSSNAWSTFFHGVNYVFILTKEGWAEFWAIFSQTHHSVSFLLILHVIVETASISQ